MKYAGQFLNHKKYANNRITFFHDHKHVVETKGKPAKRE